jgi:cyclophilin family peptidyl-prolyl cis-trans isomerase
MKHISIIVLLTALWSCSPIIKNRNLTVVPYNTEKTESKLPKPKTVPEGYKVTNRVEIKTTMGTMVVGLYGDDAPKTVKNFLQYVKSGFYTGKIFHRVIPGFMIQGGGFDKNLVKAPVNPPVELELIPGLEHDVGVISMARTNVLDSATSQFFICVMKTPQLNGAYAAFGKLEQGFDVLEAISKVPTGSLKSESEQTTMDDVPITPVIIESITILN